MKPKQIHFYLVFCAVCSIGAGLVVGGLISLINWDAGVIGFIAVTGWLFSNLLLRGPN